MTEQEKKAIEKYKATVANFRKKTESPELKGVIITKKDDKETKKSVEIEVLE